MNLEDLYGETELNLINVNHLGLKKKAYAFKRGARTSQKYIDMNDLDGEGNPIVNAEEIYDNIWSADGIRLESFTRTLFFYHQDGSVYHQIDTTPDIDDVMMEEIMESVWKRQIRYLKVAAEKLAEQALTLPEPMKTQYGTIAANVLTIFAHYDSQIAKYESHGFPDFEDAVNNETDPTILALLQTPVRAPDAEFPVGLTAKTSIIHQLTGVIPT